MDKASLVFESWSPMLRRLDHRLSSQKAESEALRAALATAKLTCGDMKKAKGEQKLRQALEHIREEAGSTLTALEPLAKWLAKHENDIVELLGEAPFRSDALEYSPGQPEGTKEGNTMEHTLRGPYHRRSTGAMEHTQLGHPTTLRALWTSIPGCVTTIPHSGHRSFLQVLADDDADDTLLGHVIGDVRGRMELLADANTALPTGRKALKLVSG